MEFKTMNLKLLIINMFCVLIGIDLSTHSATQAHSFPPALQRISVMDEANALVLSLGDGCRHLHDILTTVLSFKPITIQYLLEQTAQFSGGYNPSCNPTPPMDVLYTCIVCLSVVRSLLLFLLSPSRKNNIIHIIHSCCLHDRSTSRVCTPRIAILYCYCNTSCNTYD